MNRLSLILLAGVGFLVGASAPSKADANIQVLASFVPAPNGLYPQTPLIQGTDGSLYGTTSQGGAYAAGTVFKVLPTGGVVTVHSFNGTTDGSTPTGLTEGRDGAFYGTTQGDNNSTPGTIFKVTSRGTFTVLVTLGIPSGVMVGLVQGGDGNFYGMSDNTVFQMTPAGSLTNLANIDSSGSGTTPTSPLIVGSDGNIYGTYFGTIFQMTLDGAVTYLTQNQTSSYTNLFQGSDGNFYGIANDESDNQQIFKITPQGVLTLVPASNTDLDSVFNFIQGTDSNFYGVSSHGDVFKLTMAGVFSVVAANPDGNPVSYLMEARNGILYGMMPLGGTYGYGTIFRLTTAGKWTTFYTFETAGGSNPYGALVEGAPGNFYGVTDGGGPANDGTVFRVTAQGVMQTLNSFSGTNGNGPNGLTLGRDGNFYGTTYSGGDEFEDGTVFKISPTGILKSLYTFGSDVSHPGPLLLASDGNLYGAAGPFNGIIFRINAAGQFSVFSVFPLDESAGIGPVNNLVQGKNGTIYGMANANNVGAGTIFEMNPASGKLSTFVDLTNYGYGYVFFDFLMGQDGCLYGENPYLDESGGIFKVTPQGTLTTFASFFYQPTFFPQSGLIQDAQGNFYGVTYLGGASNGGSVFAVSPQGAIHVLGNFDSVGGPTDVNKLTLGKDGNLYGTDSTGGTANAGYVFRVMLPKSSVATPQLGHYNLPH